MEGLLLTVHDGVNVGANRAHERVERLQLRRLGPVPVRKASYLLCTTDDDNRRPVAAG